MKKAGRPILRAAGSVWGLIASVRASAHGPNRGQRYGLESNSSFRQRRLRGAVRERAPRPLPILGRSWRAFLGPGGRRPDAEAWLATPSPIRRARRGPQRRLVINKNTQNATAEGDGILPCPFAAMTVLQNDGLIRGRSAPSVFTPASVGCLVCPSENGSEQPIIEHGGWPRR
jgi:hypothetical protein